LPWLKTRSRHEEIVVAAMWEIADWLNRLDMAEYRSVWPKSASRSTFFQS